MIYVITDGEYQKIGYSGNPVQRVSDIQVANAREITFIAVLKGGRIDEARMQEYYAEYHVRGEWYKLPYEHIAAIYFMNGNFLTGDIFEKGITVSQDTINIVKGASQTWDWEVKRSKFATQSVNEGVCGEVRLSVRGESETAVTDSWNAFFGSEWR